MLDSEPQTDGRVRYLDWAGAIQRLGASISSKEERLVAQGIELVVKYGRYGYRRITAVLRQDGLEANHKRVERIWRREGGKSSLGKGAAEAAGILLACRKPKA